MPQSLLSEIRSFTDRGRVKERREAREEEEREIATVYPLPASYNNEIEAKNVP